MRARGWAAALAAFGLIERVGLWLVYSPVSYGDTPTYLRLAGILGDAGLAGYDASRVPGYPLFMLALGQDPDRVWLAQMALGWGISLLLFWIGWRSTRSARLGIALGMLYNLIPGQVLFEANLLSETLTMFCVMVSLALLIGLEPSRGNDTRRALPASAALSVGHAASEASGGPASDLGGSDHSRPGRMAQIGLILLGLFGGLSGLIRALFYPLVPWLALLVARLRRRWLPSMALFAVPAALLLGGWVGVVYQQYGMLSPTTMGGYHLVQHTGEFFEYLPDQYADLRDTYLKYRDAQVAQRGTQTNAIWDAIPELSDVTGLSFFGLSAELQRLSIQLILAHPGLYLANVVQGWIDFWKAPAIWDPAALQLAGLEPIFRGWARVGRGICLVANGVFLALSALVAAAAALTLPARAAVWPQPGRQPLDDAPLQPLAAGTPMSPGRARVARSLLVRLGVDSTFVAAAGLVWMTSIVQTLVDHGDNPRFLVPLQMVVVFVVLRAGYHWITSKEGIP